jgi:putative oxidoreductase
MFPNGLPGKGLLILRLLAGTLLIHDGLTGLANAIPPAAVTREVIEVGTGIFLVAGLWTPIAGALVLIVEVWIIFSGPDQMRFALVLAALGCALAMLGPGAISVDSLIYGRKRIEIRERQG